MPLPPPDRQPEWEASAARLGDRLPVHRALKQLVMRTEELERQVAELSPGEPAAEIVEDLGPRPASAPGVSVLLPLHDRADFVDEALRSVALGGHTDVEVVAVDDGSADRAAAAVEAVCAELPWLPVRLVRRDRGAGGAVLRNAALAHARGDLVLALGADDVLLPRGLGTLARALGERPDAAFAYGMLATFDATGPVGLEGWLDWTPDRLRYGNFVDGMALVRRAAVEAVGGYPTDAPLAGWEDFALWVALADAGRDGVRAPEIVGRRRVAVGRGIALADVDRSEGWATLLRRYPSLAAGVA